MAVALGHRQSISTEVHMRKFHALLISAAIAIGLLAVALAASAPYINP
jgi:hypothetical protein